MECDGRRKAEDEKDRDSRHFQDEVFRLTEKLEAARAERDELIRRREEVQALLDEEVARRKHAIVERDQERDCFAEARDAVNEQIRLRRDIEDNVAELRRHLRASEKENEHQKRLLDDADKKNTNLQKDIMTLHESIDGLQAELKACRNHLDESDMKNREYEIAMSTEKQACLSALASLEQERGKCCSEKERADSEHDRFLAEKMRADNEEREKQHIFERWERERERRESVEVDRDREVQNRVATELLRQEVERALWDLKKATAIEVEAERKRTNEAKNGWDEAERTLANAYEHSRSLDAVIAKLRSDVDQQVSNLAECTLEKHRMEVRVDNFTI